MGLKNSENLRSNNGDEELSPDEELDTESESEEPGVHYISPSNLRRKYRMRL